MQEACQHQSHVRDQQVRMTHSTVTVLGDSRVSDGACRRTLEPGHHKVAAGLLAVLLEQAEDDLAGTAAA